MSCTRDGLKRQKLQFTKIETRSRKIDLPRNSMHGRTRVEKWVWLGCAHVHLYNTENIPHEYLRVGVGSETGIQLGVA